MALCEIFKAGEHTDSSGRKKTWTEKDLEQIATNFSTNPDVPICVGHPKQNAPAYGWVNSIKKVGEKLYCDFKQVQDEFKTAVNKGLFKTRSVSIDPNTMNLRHIAFLGAAAPAIKGMEEFSFSECKNEKIIEFLFEGFDFNEDDFSEQLNVKDTKIAELEEKLQKVQAEKTSKEINDFCDKAISVGNILPVHREKVVNLLQSCSDVEMNFSQEDKPQTLELLKEFLNDIKVMNFTQITKDKDATNTIDDLSASEWKHALQEEIKKAKENGEIINSIEAATRLKAKTVHI